MRDEAADRNSREIVEKRKYGVPDLATYILEINVNSVGTGFGELPGQVRRSMVDGRIET